MIYRIIIPYGEHGMLAWAVMCDIMNASLLKAPKRLQNRRTRFWFTERGWNDVGRGIAEEMQKRGLSFRVKKMKNPKASDVAWQDPYQIAMLGGGKK